MAVQRGNRSAPAGFRQYLRQTQNLDKQARKAYNQDFRLLAALAIQQLGEDELLKLADEVLPGQSSVETAHLHETARLMGAWAKQVISSQKVQ